MPLWTRPAAPGWLSRAVFLVAGTVLLVAAFLKGQQLTTTTFVPGDVLPTRLAVALAVACEFTLGVWLYLGLCPAVARVTALACFTAFFVVAVRQLAAGRVSCGCFGRVDVAPWLTAAFDLAMVAALVWIRPPQTGPHQTARGLAFAAAVAAAIVWASEAAAPADGPALTLSPPVIALGELRQGQKATGNLVITNNSATEQAIDGFTTSCPCVDINPPSLVLAPGQSACITAEVDLAREPDFTRGLAVQVTGRAKTAVVQFLVEITVRPGS